MFKKSTIFIFLFLLNSPLFASKIEILSDTPGTGPEIKNHYKVSVHYRGFLENGTEFDSSFKRNQPFVFQIGVRQVIPGWELGLMGMKVGGKRKLKIPPELAYGDNAVTDLIPANSTLIFEIEVISIQEHKYINIEPNELTESKINNFILIDIRTEDEWKKTGIIKGSKKINAFDPQGNFNPGFINIFQSITKKNELESKVIFIGTNGEVSSILANGFAEQLGYKYIYNLSGGIEKWKKLGFKLK
tara:strand:+ start:19238 stop:19972 length:735 start_codon:yes stop_codon:yes gene_type:complete